MTSRVLRRRGDRGMVTAEAALVLPVLVLLVCVAVSAISVATAQLRCVDAAREAARAAARGETDAEARSTALRAAPPQSTVELGRGAERVEVTVRVKVRPIGGLFPAVTVTGQAVSDAEPGRP